MTIWHQQATTRGPHRAVPLHFLVLLLITVAAAWGSLLMIFGDSVASSPTYDLLRGIPGGMHTWGASLSIGALLMGWALGRDDEHSHPKALNRALAGGILFYGTWSFVLIWTWLSLQSIPSAAALIFNVAWTALYYRCARAAAPPPKWANQDVRSG